MRRILITGGAGFIGSHLATRLVAAGHHVIALDNFSTGHPDNVAHLVGSDRFELIRHDVIEHFFTDVDEIYHLACPASVPAFQKNAVRTLKTAFIGTMKMLELARETGARVLIASTSEIYGQPEVHPQREDYWGYANPIGKRSCYDEGKRCSESLAVAFAQHYQVQTRIVRIFNTYGPRMHESDGRVVSNLIMQALAGRPLTVYGDGTQTRSLCYQSDLVSGLVAMMDLGIDPGPINLGNPEEMSIQQLAELILRLTKSRSTISYCELPADDPIRRRPDIAKAKRILRWEPTVSAAEGLAETIDYYRGRISRSSASRYEDTAPASRRASDGSDESIARVSRPS